MVEPITLGLGVASLASGLLGGRAQDRAASRQRRLQRAEIATQREELAEAKEAFEEEQDRIARAIANSLVDRGISSSSIAEGAKQRFVAQRGRGEMALDRRRRRLEAGIISGNIQQDLQTALQRANQLQNTIGLVGLLAQSGIFGGGPAPAGRQAALGAATGGLSGLGF